MTRGDDRRRRVVRIRTVEHRIAQQELARARQGARQIESVVERIEALARDNIVPAAGTDGASLAAISEMSTRLAHAKASTAGPLQQALQHVSVHQSNTIAANVKAENANSSLKKAVRKNSADIEMREHSARCFRAIAASEDL